MQGGNQKLMEDQEKAAIKVSVLQSVFGRYSLDHGSDEWRRLKGSMQVM